MGFKALLSESLFECCARGFYDLLLFINVICIGFKAFPRYCWPARGFYRFLVVLSVICMVLKRFLVINVTCMGLGCSLITTVGPNEFR